MSATMPGGTDIRLDTAVSAGALLRVPFAGAGNQGPFGRSNTAGGGAGGQAGAGNADRLTAMSPGVSAGTRRHGTMSPVEETGDPAARAVRLRRAGRVIVLDPEDRVLLFRYDEGPPNGRHWSTPGGGLNDGEDYPAGARREVAEETGWTDVVLGREVYERTLTMEYADAIVRQHERFFLARVRVSRRGLGEVAAMHVSDGIAAWRWWTLAEMDATEEVIWPAGLADLIRGLTG